MNRESARRPSSGTVVAIIALALATTPLADAATSKGTTSKPKAAPVVAHAKYADNADKVNNYKASIHPAPDTLLPLGPNGKFPASVLPAGSTTSVTGPQGPAGPAGPAGPSGLNSPGVVTIVFQANGTSLATTGSASATCAPGTKVLGGGFSDLTRTVPSLASGLPPGSVDEVEESDPFANTDGTSGWRVRIVNIPPAGVATGGTTFFQAYAICGG